MNSTRVKKDLQKLLRASFLVVLVLALIPLLLSIDPIDRFIQTRFRHRIEQALTQALGRPVKGGNVDLTTISGFGFNMDNVSIGEALGFGDEPFVYSERIHFVLSWHSLVSRRIEIANITFRQGSINLVRNAAGQWNFEPWFSDSKGQPGAPTANVGRPVAKDRSPFIVAVYFVNSRINFKDLRGSPEKKVFILAEMNGKIQPAWFDNGVDFDLKFKPTRTDLPLENSGLVRVTGSLGPFRNLALWSAPLQGQIKIEKFRYSDAVALLFGRVTSILGQLDGRAVFRGPLNGILRWNGQIKLTDLHSWRARPREQFLSAGLVFPQLDMKIGGPLTWKNAKLNVGSSAFTIQGEIDRLADPSIGLTCSAEKMHLDDALDFARGFADAIPTSTHWLGDTSIQLRVQGPWRAPSLEAKAESSATKIQSPSLPQPINVMPFKVSFQDATMTWSSIRIEEPSNRSIQFSGSIEDLFKTRRFDFTAVGHNFRLESVEGLVRAFGVWNSPLQGKGWLDFSLLQSGQSRKHAGPALLNGWINARDLTLYLGTNEPARIAAARIDFKNDSPQVSLTKVNWGHSVASGSISFPRLDYRQAHANVNASFLDLDELVHLCSESRNQLFPAGFSFPSVTSASSAPPAEMGWEGKIASTWLYMKPLQVTRVRSNFRWASKSLRLSNLFFEAYGGKSESEVALDWGGTRPRIAVQGRAENVRLDSLVNVLTPLGPSVQGRVSGEYRLSGEKSKGAPWKKSLEAHVFATARELENVSLTLPTALQGIQERLKLPFATSGEAPMTLDVDIQYAQENARINKARFSRHDLSGVFFGSCSKKLELELTGTVERVSTKKDTPPSSLSIAIRGPLARAQIVLPAEAKR